MSISILHDSKLHQLQFVNTREHLSVLPLLDERQEGQNFTEKKNETGN